VEKKHRIVEIEFYYKDSKVYIDPFCHGDEQQKMGGTFYFHRQNGKGYKGGSFKGMDIAFGDKDAVGGILIRAVQQLEGEKKIN